MNERQEGYLRLADANLVASRHLYDLKDYPGIIVSRAYYSMFYCASALLEGVSLRYGSHGQLVGAFGREFVKTGRFDPKFNTYLREAFDLRSSGDYDVDSPVHEDDALQAIHRAEEFLAETRRYLTNHNP